MLTIYCPKPIRKNSPITIKASQDELEPLEITHKKMFHYFSYRLRRDSENKILMRDIDRIAPKVKDDLFEPVNEIEVANGAYK